MLNERGTFESDLTAQRLATDHYRLFVGTNAIARDLAWLTRHVEGFDVALRDSTEDYAVLGLMGPNSARIAAACGAVGIDDIGYFKHAALEMAGVLVRAARLSYVGEAGWEITCAAKHASALYAAMTVAGAVPAGLFAQTAMRIEKGFCAMGHELDGDVTPIAAGLDFALRKSGGYLGADALAAAKAAGETSRVCTIVLDDVDAVPLGQEPIYHNGQIVGETSSAAFGYRVGRPIALGHLHHALPDASPVSLDIAGVKVPGRIVIGPAFDPDGTRMRSRSLVNG